MPVAASHVAVNEVPLEAVRRPQPIGSANGPIPVPAAAVATSQPSDGNSMIRARPQGSQLLNQAPRGVVMQPVPVDPLAGKVEPRVGTNHAARSLPSKAGNEIPVKTLVKADISKPTAPPAKPLSPAESIEVKAVAMAKTANKPSAVARTKMEANKGVPDKPASALSSCVASGKGCGCKTQCASACTKGAFT